MPYLLLTFEEIADLYHCDAADARRRAIHNQWERRRWPDGLTRVHVPPEVAHQFMLNYAAKYEPSMPPDAGLDAEGASEPGRDIAALVALASTRPIGSSMPI